MIRVYDTRAGRVRPFEPYEPGRVRIYVCGVTPYDRPHVGHARPAVVWDVIRRHLETRGYAVTLVQNVTDVDDRLIERAAAAGTTVSALAEEHLGTYWRLVTRLRVRPPDFLPRATDNVDPILAIIERLMDQGLAYRAGPDVYYRVRAFPGYGALSHRDPDALRAGARIEPSPHKEDPLDFALWKGVKPGEPSWPSPWGEGRPGWHVECSAMSWRYLGPVVDMHGGGVDLIFPHHENEIAQSEPALNVSPHVRYWVHNGLVTQEGVKMSKSLGNGWDLEDLLRQFEPEAVRGYLLSTHYRTPIAFSVDGVAEFRRGLERVWRLWDEVADAMPARVVPEGDDGRLLVEFPERLAVALDEDFNTARAFAVVFEMVRAAFGVMQRGGRIGEAAAGLARRNLETADHVLQILPVRQAAGSDVLPPDVARLVAEREVARRERDWARADTLREAVLARGWQIQDTPDGPAVRPLDRRVR